NSGCVYNRLQAARPQDAPRLHAIIKRTHSGEVAGKNDGTVGVIVYHDTPIADEVDKAARSPTFVGGERKRCVAGIVSQPVCQDKTQISAIVQPSIPKEDLGPLIAVTWAVQPT